MGWCQGGRPLGRQNGLAVPDRSRLGHIFHVPIRGQVVKNDFQSGVGLVSQVTEVLGTEHSCRQL